MASDDPTLRLGKLDWRTIEGETIILDRGTERYLSLNRSGTLIWQQLADGTTRGALVAKLIDTFGIDEDLAGRDVDAFVADVRSFGLLDDAAE